MNPKKPLSKQVPCSATGIAVLRIHPTMKTQILPASWTTALLLAAATATLLPHSALAQSGLTAKPLTGPAATQGGAPNQWLGEWTLHESQPDSLAVTVGGGDSGKTHLRIAVTPPGDPQGDKPQGGAALSRAVKTSEWQTDSGARIAFEVWLEDPKAFLYRRAGFGICSSDQPDTSSLSSRSGWNFFCFGAATPVGETTVQAGEIGLRVRTTPRGELQTLPTGVFLGTGEKARIVISQSPDGQTFGVRVAGGGSEFSREGLGYWAEQPFGGAKYLNLYFSALPTKPYTVNLFGPSLEKAP